MPKYCPATNKDDCSRQCRGFDCKARAEKKRPAWDAADHYRRLPKEDRQVASDSFHGQADVANAAWGTVTGRMKSSSANFTELVPRPRADDAVDVDYRALEERIAAQMVDVACGRVALEEAADVNVQAYMNLRLPAEVYQTYFYADSWDNWKPGRDIDGY